MILVLRTRINVNSTATIIIIEGLDYFIYILLYIILLLVLHHSLQTENSELKDNSNAIHCNSA